LLVDPPTEFELSVWTARPDDGEQPIAAQSNAMKIDSAV
jgi:hypothetical protein